MNLSDLNSSLSEIESKLRYSIDEIDSLIEQVEQLHNSDENTLNFEFSIPKLNRFKTQLVETIGLLPDNLNNG